jgi:hypothetical protein
MSFGAQVYNDAGELIVSNIYPTPAFVGKATLTPSGGEFTLNSWKIQLYTVTYPSVPSTQRMVFVHFPDGEDVWWASNLSARFRTGTQGSTLPEAYVFEAGNGGITGGGFGLVIYSASGAVMAGGSRPMLGIRSLPTLQYSSTAFPDFGNTPIDNNMGSPAPKPAFLIPPFYSVRSASRPPVSDIYESWGAIKRSNNILSTRLIMLTTATEDDGGSNWYELFGQTSNACPMIDGYIYD